MKVLKIKMNFGISILLKYFYIFEYMLINNMYDYIYVSIDCNILKELRDSDDNYYNNYVLFFRHINKFNNLILDTTNNYEKICVAELSKKYNIPIKFKIYDGLLINSVQLDYEYITISTKILGINLSLYNQFKNNLIKCLNMKKYIIVLLGERTISNCKEYKIHETYSIYNDLISSLTNYKDFTIESDKNNNELTKLLFTFGIFNKSKLNIFIGNSGVSELIPYSSNNILGFTYKDNVLCKDNYLHDNINNVHIFDNHEEFMKCMQLFM